MEIREARVRLEYPGNGIRPSVWDDLGCGIGTFTLSLANCWHPEVESMLLT